MHLICSPKFCIALSLFFISPGYYSRPIENNTYFKIRRRGRGGGGGGQGLDSVHCGDAQVAYRLFPGTWMIDRALLPWHDYLICLLINSTIFDGIQQVDNRMEVVSFAMLIVTFTCWFDTA